MASGQDLHEYMHFAGRQRRDSALHHLNGILDGIAMDGVINAEEIRELRDWSDSNQRVAEKDRVFLELMRVLNLSLDDGKIDAEELADLKALCDRAKSNSAFYEAVTHAIQELHGILHGVVSDMKVSDGELRGLQDWLENYSDIRNVWPITEIESLIVKVLGDGKIDEAEERLMLRFFSEFAPSVRIADRLPELLPTEITVAGVCAVDPEIVFDGRSFCFTGVSSRGPRQMIADTIRKKGGHFSDNVTKGLDYLVIGDDGNPCWAFACYGRKVERVVQMRREGSAVMLIHERDFWDALV